MFKNNKNVGNDGLEVCNMDNIGYMTAEMIHDRVVRLENNRNRLLSMGKNPYFLEVEIAYFRREQDIRRICSERHVEFTKRLIVPVNIDDVNVAVPIVSETETNNNGGLN